MRVEPFFLNNKPAFYVYRGSEKLGVIETYENMFHKQNCYLKFDLNVYDETVAGSLIHALRRYFDRPMQVMLASTEGTLAKFLKAGGFRCNAPLL